MSAPGAWEDAALAAALLAVDARLGGAALRARSGPAQVAWVALALRLAPDRAPLRLPPGVSDDRLYGGLDLAATFVAGRPVTAPGLLDRADGRILILPMAERAGPALAARLGAALDAGGGFTLIALDEGAEPDENMPEALADRLAFRPRLEAIALAALDTSAWTAETVAAARAILARVRTPEGLAADLAAVALALGIGSLRAPLLALAAARAAAALAGSGVVDAAAAATAARLVLAPRARSLPAADDPSPPTDAPPPPAPDADGPKDGEGRADRPPDEILLDAACAAIPPDVIARLLAAGPARASASASAGGAAGAGARRSKARGRPAGTARGTPRDGGRLDLVETLRAAAPWQPLRRRAAADAAGGRVLVRADDFRVKRCKPRAEQVVIFAVDASGSTALARLAEAKGAIELMLGQAYVARRQVALIAFRGASAETLLPPTRSLARTKRRLAALPGGGGTPLAAGLDAALDLARQLRARGIAPHLALLTDGRANIALDGAPGRPQAEADAMRLARLCRAEPLPATLIDTSVRPAEAARALASAMGAAYLALPRADARVLSGALGAAVAGAA